MGHFQTDIEAVGRIAALPTILEVVCRTTGMGFTAVARVTEDRWVACAVRDEIGFGLVPGGELKDDTTISHEIHRSREPVVIDNVAEDETYSGRYTPALYGFQSFISMPIMLSDGTFFGTLCSIDPHPARLQTPHTIGMFRLFAELIAFHLDAIKRQDVTEATLQSERATSELREQFIAVLGHDLRNPLASIDAGARMLQRTRLDEKSLAIINLVQQSVIRMSALIDNVLDFARGRLGGGFTLERIADAPLGSALDQVIAELRSSWPYRKIETEIAMDGPIDCDPAKISQLFSNLLSNALTYGPPDQPIHVRAKTDDGALELSVANGGEPIPPAALEHLFRPFTRGAVRPSQQGLGLGLYIASEIARAHGGTLDVVSLPVETRFTFRMPLRRIPLVKPDPWFD